MDRSKLRIATNIAMLVGSKPAQRSHLITIEELVKTREELAHTLEQLEPRWEVLRRGNMWQWRILHS